MLVVGLVFLPKNSGHMVGTYECHLPFCEHRRGHQSTCRWWGHLNTTLCVLAPSHHCVLLHLCPCTLLPFPCTILPLHPPDPVPSCPCALCPPTLTFSHPCALLLLYPLAPVVLCPCTILHSHTCTLVPCTTCALPPSHPSALTPSWVQAQVQKGARVWQQVQGVWGHKNRCKGIRGIRVM